MLWTYGYNAAGGLRSVTRDNPGSSPGQADAFAWTRHYAVNRAYATNGLNQYIGTGGPTFTYDDNGNLTSDGERAYLYDIENRLVLTSTGASLSYDPLGRLYQVAGGGNITRFLYDGDALVVEYDTAGVVKRRHVHGAGADTAMITYQGENLATPQNLFADHQGSIIAAAGANGATLSVNTYDEYGIPGLGNTGRFQYTGQVWLSELGMYYYKARIYSPTFGRFLQTDPIGYEDQFNLYGYVGNDPVNNVDPTGMATNDEIRRARQTLNSLRAAIRRDIAAASLPAVGSRMVRNSDSARVQGLRTQLNALSSLRPEALADMRVNAPDASMANGLTNAMSGAPAETAYAATSSNGGVAYEDWSSLRRRRTQGRQGRQRICGCSAIGITPAAAASIRALATRGLCFGSMCPTSTQWKAAAMPSVGTARDSLCPTFGAACRTTSLRPRGFATPFSLGEL